MSTTVNHMSSVHFRTPHIWYGEHETLHMYRLNIVTPPTWLQISNRNHRWRSVTLIDERLVAHSTHILVTNSVQRIPIFSLETFCFARQSPVSKNLLITSTVSIPNVSVVYGVPLVLNGSVWQQVVIEKSRFENNRSRRNRFWTVSYGKTRKYDFFECARLCRS